MQSGIVNPLKLITKMKEYGETQEDLARMLNISRQALNGKLHTRLTRFSLEEISLLAEHYNVSRDYFFERD